MANGGGDIPAASSADPELRTSIVKRMYTFLEIPTHQVGDLTLSAIADDGFVYVPRTGAIVCVFCDIVVADWKSIGSVSVIRQLHNPNCRQGPDPATERDPLPPDDQLEGRSSVEDEVDLGSRREQIRSQNEQMRMQTTCKRCLRSAVETLFLPCRHLVACERCADEVQDCFVCNDKILGTVRIYMN